MTSRAQQILAEVSEDYGVPISLLKARDRKPSVCMARDEAMWKMRQLKSVHHGAWSFPHIGKVMGRDHSSVLMAVRRHQERLDNGLVRCDIQAEERCNARLRPDQSARKERKARRD